MQQEPTSSMLQATVPLANGIGGGHSMPPSLQGSAALPKPSGGPAMQPGAPAVQSGAPAQHGSLNPAKPFVQSPASGVAAELRAREQGFATAAGFGGGMTTQLLPPSPADSCARCRLWEGPGHGKVRPQRLDCAAYGGPVVANGDGTVANWLGLHGWQVVRTGGRQQGQRQGQRSRSRQPRGSRKRNWDDSDVSYSGSDSEESDVSSVPSERGGRGDKQNEADAPPPDPERPELRDSDEDSEYEAMRRAKERRQTTRGRRVSTRVRGATPPPAEPAPKRRKRPRPAPKPTAGPAAAGSAAMAARAPADPAVGGGAAAATAAGLVQSPPTTGLQQQLEQPGQQPPVPAPAAASAPLQQGSEAALVVEASGASEAAPDMLPDAQLQQETPPEDEQEDESEEEEEEPEPEPVVLVRRLSEEEKAADHAAVRASPNFASILDFLQTFRPQLKLSRAFGAVELEAVLVASPGDEGLLPDIHMDMLRGINSRILVGNSNWARHVASKLFNHWRHNAIWKFSDPPFLVAKDEDAAMVYSQLPSLARVAALKALCEMRLDKDDLRAAVDAAAGPRRRLKKGEVDDSRTLDDFRRAPLGEDARGRAYWYHDFHDSTGLRLYRESLAGAAAQQSADDGTDHTPQISDSTAAAPADTHAGEGASAAPSSPAARRDVEAVAEPARARSGDEPDGTPAGNTGTAAADGEANSAAAAAAALMADEAPSAAAAAKQRSAAAAAAATKAAEEAAAAEAAAAAAKPARPRGRSGGQRSRGGRAVAFDPPGSQACCRTEVDEAPAGAWECIAASVEELEAVGHALLQSGRPADVEMASLVLEDLVPEAVEAATEAARKEARRGRLQRDLAASIIPGEGPGRSRRQRKEVDYTYGDYNTQILSAVRGPRDPEEPIPRWALDEEERPSPAQEVALGLRRGRSHRDAALAAGLPDERLNGRSGSRTPAASAANSADLGGDSDADAAAGDGQPRPHQQHTSRLQQATGPPPPQALLPPGVGAPSSAPPSQFPTAAAPLPNAAPAGDATQEPQLLTAQPMDVDAAQPQPPSQY